MRNSLWSFALLFSVIACGQASHHDESKDASASMGANDVARAAAAYSFDGIVKIPGCSGSIVQFDDAAAADLALVLSNGHCAGFPAAGTATGDKKVSVSVTLMNAKGSSVGTVKATKLEYATMTKTDISLYQLPISYADLESKYGVHTLTMSREHPALGDAIDIISGYWKTGFTCAIDEFAYSLKEGDWTMNDSIRFTEPGCATYGGTSGSPVLAHGTRTVVAVNNTGNESGGRCTDNNPCEIAEDGTVTYQKGWSYAQETYWLYGCRGGDNADSAGFDFSLETCELVRPATAGSLAH